MVAGRFSRLAGALLAALAFSCLLWAAAVAPAEAKITCHYAQAGPAGNRGNVLEIRVSKFEESVALDRGAGGTIKVSDDQRMRRLRCSGKQATMTNIDRVSFVASRAAVGTFFTLARPYFGPGATPYEDGGTGIGFVVKGKGVTFGTVGTPGNDTFYMGMDGKAAAVDIFHGEPFPEGSPKHEVDVLSYAKHRNFIFLGGEGDDVIASVDRKNRDFDSRLTRDVPVSAYGEEGTDYLWGGSGPDYLDGGGGNDTLKSFGGADFLFGGKGLDLFESGSGDDEIDAIDRTGGETINCGPGDDLSNMDLKDLDDNCESFLFP